MGKKLQVTKRENWIKQGAPEQALNFLDAAVEKLSDFAVEKQIIFKGEDGMTNDEVVVENGTVTEVANTEVVETPAAETPEPTQTEEVKNVDLLAVIQKGIVDAVEIALKEYNSTVVAPLQAQLSELSASVSNRGQAPVVKGFSNVENVFFGASDFMPASAVAAMLKKNFGGQSAETITKEDLVVEDVEKVETVVKEKKVTAGPTEANILAGF